MTQPDEKQINAVAATIYFCIHGGHSDWSSQPPMTHAAYRHIAAEAIEAYEREKGS